MTLQEKTYETFADHAVYINKYAQTVQRRILSEITFLLNEIKEELSKGERQVTLTDVRAMVRQADKLFKDGYSYIEKNIFDDSYELLETELEGQVKLLQDVLDNYNVHYTVRTPSVSRTKKKLEELPLKGQTITDWLNLWQQKTRNIIKTALIANYGQVKEGQEDTTEVVETKDRYDILDSVFGEGEKPLTHSTFLRSGSDIGALLVSLTDSVMAETSSSIGASNPGIIVGEVWNSCLCSTTCGLCASLHGAVRYYSGIDETDGNEIPLHPNCQCHWTYAFRDARQMNARISKEDRANINSDVSPLKGKDWFNSLGKQRQIDMFGTTRVKMLEAGTITFNELLTTRDRRLFTLQELRDKGYRVL